MAAVLLPCEVEEWWEDKRLFLLLSSIRSVKDLEQLITSHTRESSEQTVLSDRLKKLSGLIVFLRKYCDNNERGIYTSVTLPFIAQTASKLDELVPTSGIPFIVRQEAASLVLGRKLVLCLIANAFLCTFPENGCQHIETFSFTELFSAFNNSGEEKTLKSRAAKIKCFLCYFHKVSEERSDLSGMITIRRQVIQPENLFTLADWTAHQKLLCILKVDEANTIESSGSHTLQVDFANRKLGGGVLRGGCVQEEIKFCVFPELLISRLIMDHMEDNEAIIVTGAEQFSKYSGYGPSFEFAGEYEDPAERDVFGNILTSTVAIDAYPFHSDPEKQYEPDMLLRELNKAYAGYLCLQDRGDISAELIALSNQGPSSAFIAEHYPNHHSLTTSWSADSALGNLNPSSQSSFQLSFKLLEQSIPVPPLSPIKELNESTQCLCANLTESIIKVGVKEAAKVETSSQELKQSVDGYASSLVNSLFSDVVTPTKTQEKQPVDDFALTLSSSLLSDIKPKEPPPVQPSAVDDDNPVSRFASSLAGSLFSDKQSSLPESSGVTASKEPTEISHPIDRFASTMASSLFNDIRSSSGKSAAAAKSQNPTGVRVNDLAFSLSSTILKSSLETTHSDGKRSALNDAKANELAQSIISDVFSSLEPAPAPEPPSTRTTGESTNQLLSSFSDQIASNILVGSLSGVQQGSGGAVDHPTILIQVERRGSAGVNESPRSSRSSSLTGQTITVHEFTDDLADNLIRDGVSIAQYTSQSQEVNIPPQLTQKDANQVAEKLTESIVNSVKKDSQSTSTKTPAAGEEPLSSSSYSAEYEGPNIARKLLKNRLLFSKQELAMVAARMSKKRGSLNDQSGHSDTETPSFPGQLNTRLLTPSSSRHSLGYAWSIASTRDDGSRPASPTDFDRIALSLVTDPTDHAHIFTKLLLSDAILSVCGERPKHLQQSDISNQFGALNMNSLTSESKIDTYLNMLEEAEVLSQSSVDDGGSQQPFSLQQRLNMVLLRPVATGNWGCGAFKGNPQLKSLLQLAVASMCDRPQMIYHTYKNQQLKDLAKVAEHLMAKRFTVGQLCTVLLEYANRSAKKREAKDLFTVLLEM